METSPEVLSASMSPYTVAGSRSISPEVVERSRPPWIVTVTSEMSPEMEDRSAASFSWDATVTLPRSISPEVVLQERVPEMSAPVTSISPLVLEKRAFPAIVPPLRVMLPEVEFAPKSPAVRFCSSISPLMVEMSSCPALRF